MKKNIQTNNTTLHVKSLVEKNIIYQARLFVLIGLYLIMNLLLMFDRKLLL